MVRNFKILLSVSAAQEDIKVGSPQLFRISPRVRCMSRYSESDSPLRDVSALRLIRESLDVLVVMSMNLSKYIL